MNSKSSRFLVLVVCLLSVLAGAQIRKPPQGLPPPGTYRKTSPASATLANLVAPMPRPTTIGWGRWIQDLREATDAYCPAEQGTVYYYSLAGSDTNDGRDGLGLNLSGATYTASTHTFAKTGGFTSYVFQPGDRLYSSGLGLVRVDSRTNNNAIVIAPPTAWDFAVNPTAAAAVAIALSSDASGLTTSNGPQKTMSKLQSLLDSASAPITPYLHSGDKWRVLPPIVAVSASTGTTVSYTTANLTRDGVTQTIPVGMFVTLIDSSGVHQTSYVTSKSGTTTTVLTLNDAIAITPTYVGPTNVVDFHNFPVTMGAYGVGKRAPMLSAFELLTGYPYSNPSGDLRRWQVTVDPNNPGSNTSGSGGLLRRSGLWAALKPEGSVDDPFVRVNTDADMFGQSEVYTLQSTGTVSGGTFAFSGALNGSSESISSPTVDPSTNDDTAAHVQAQLDKIFPSGTTTVTGSSFSSGWTITFTGQYANRDIRQDLVLAVNVPTGGGSVALTKVQDGIYPVPKTSGAWRQSGTTTYLMLPDHAQSLNGNLKMEILAQNSYSAIGTSVNGVDKCSIRGIDEEGYGCGQYDFTNHRYSGGQGATTGLMRDEAGWGFAPYIVAGQAFVISDCGMYYNGRHSAVIAGGGVGLFQRDRMAWLGRDALLAVGYNGAGGQVSLFYDNSYGGAEIPSKTGAQTANPFGYNYGASGTGSYAHTSGGANKIGLYIDYGSYYEPGPWQSYIGDGPIDVTTWNNGFTGTDPVNCTSFVVNCMAPCRDPSETDVNAPPSGTGAIIGLNNLGAQTLAINSTFNSKLLGTTGYGDVGFMDITNGFGGGVGWNNTWKFTLTKGAPLFKNGATLGISTVAGATSKTWNWHNYFSRIELYDERGTMRQSAITGRLAWAIQNDLSYSTALPTELRIYNSLVIVNTRTENSAGSNTSYIGINNNQTGGQTTSQNNAYYGGTPTGVAATDAYLGYTQDRYGVALPLLGGSSWVNPSSLDYSLVTPVSQVMKPWNLYDLGYDMDWNQRNTSRTARGPREWR